MADATYQPKVYFRQGAAVLVGANGGAIQLEDGFSFYFDSSTYEVTWEHLRELLYQSKQTVTHAQASVSVANVILPSQLYTSAKFVNLSMTSNLTAGIVWFASAPSVGQELWVRIAAGSVASGAVILSTSTGVSLITPAGSDISQIRLINSTNSWGWVHLVCMKAGEWAIADFSSATSATFA